MLGFSFYYHLIELVFKATITKFGISGGWDRVVELMTGTPEQGKIHHFAVCLRDLAVLCTDQQ